MKQPVGDILAEKGSQVYTVGPDASVSEAVREMNRRKVGALVVVDADKPVGIFTERDVLVRVVDAGREPANLKVAEVMTPNPLGIRPETSVEEAMMLVTEKRCRHLPVVEGGKLVGMVSIGDLTRWVVRHQKHHIADLTSYITRS